MNRHERLAAKARARAAEREVGAVGVPHDASPLVKHLVGRLVRTAMEGKSTKGSADLEHEDRAIACFLVCCSHLAAIKDESMRNSIIGSLSACASGCVDDNRQAMDEADKMASARGMSSRELLQAARNAGLGELAPKEPTEH